MNQSYYENIYEGVDISKIKQVKDITPFKRLKKELFLKYTKGDSILEIGCGFGEYIGLFNSKLYGTDISINALNKAKIFNPNVNFFQANGEKLPVKDSSFDCILLPDIIEHVEDDQALLKEINT